MSFARLADAVAQQLVRLKGSAAVSEITRITEQLGLRVLRRMLYNYVLG